MSGVLDGLHIKSANIWIIHPYFFTLENFSHFYYWKKYNFNHMIWIKLYQPPNLSAETSLNRIMLTPLKKYKCNFTSSLFSNVDF